MKPAIGGPGSGPARRAGTRYDDETVDRLAQMLAQMLAQRQTDDPPFVATAVARAGVHWVRPELVCWVGFSETTLDGRLRHSRFLGLRDDQDPTDMAPEQRSA